MIQNTLKESNMPQVEIEPTSFHVLLPLMKFYEITLAQSLLQAHEERSPSDLKGQSHF